MCKVTEKLAKLVNDVAQRREIQRLMIARYGKRTPRCAYTASEYLIRAGVLRQPRANTGALTSALKKVGWQWRNGATMANAVLDGIAPYTFCFAADGNKNGMSDHVYLFLKWLDLPRSVALVLDNYSSEPHPRNLGKPTWYGVRRLAYTPLWYCMVPPETS